MKSKEATTDKSLHTIVEWSAHNVGDGWAIKEAGLLEKGFSDRIAELYQYNPEANARRICKCVNAHNELVNALQNCVSFLETIEARGDALNGAKEALKKATT